MQTRLCALSDYEARNHDPIFSTASARATMIIGWTRIYSIDTMRSTFLTRTFCLGSRLCAERVRLTGRVLNAAFPLTARVSLALWKGASNLGGSETGGIHNSSVFQRICPASHSERYFVHFFRVLHNSRVLCALRFTFE